MDIVIRDARPEEYGAVGELTARAFLADGLLTFGEADPYLTELRDAARRAVHAELLVAVAAAGRVPLGSVTFVGDGGELAHLAGEGEAEFRMLAVSPGARGRGVGEALVRECLRRARARGLRRVVISSASQMHTAHRLYGRLGFVRAPERDWEHLPGDPLHAFAVDLAPDLAPRRDQRHNI
ncbi:GNAT family N-acetyltransferase [Streptomyces specialis]|uniref:GNAT family N-acetyltransferase n=1 Tax=Streptomyces specialis TaxID=498367 RepID=UPI00073F8F5B|nr:GNAT family N-acetyltransferase [Streptomyces specialis]